MNILTTNGSIRKQSNPGMFARKVGAELVVGTTKNLGRNIAWLLKQLGTNPKLQHNNL